MYMASFDSCSDATLYGEFTFIDFYVCGAIMNVHQCVYVCAYVRMYVYDSFDSIHNATLQAYYPYANCMHV